MDFTVLTSILVGLVSTIVFLVVRSYLTTYNFWRKRGVKGPTPWPIVGNSWELFFTPGDVVDKRNVTKYGRIYGTFQGNKPILVVSDASVIEKIFVTNFHQFMHHIEFNSPDPLDQNNIIAVSGDDWKRQRSVFTHALTTGRIKQALQFKDSRDLLQYVRKNEGKVINMYQMLTLEMLNVSTRAFYGLDLDLFHNSDHELIEKCQKFFSLSTGSLFIMDHVPSWILSMLNMAAFNSDSTAYVKQFVTHAVKERLKHPDVKKNDLLQCFMDAGQQTDQNKKLSDVEIMANSVVTLVGAFDTTTITTSLVLYELAMNPNVLEKVHLEIDSVMAGKEKLTYDDLSQFPYLEATIHESSRMHAVDHRGSRRVSDPQGAVVPGTNIHLPHGTLINTALHALHYDPEYWPDPERFRPERFLQENKSQIKNGSYMAFGSGPRMCPGIKFAIVNMKHPLIELLQKYTVKTTPETPDEITCKPGIINNMSATQVYLKFQERKHHN